MSKRKSKLLGKIGKMRRQGQKKNASPAARGKTPSTASRSYDFDVHDFSGPSARPFSPHAFSPKVDLEMSQVFITPEALSDMYTLVDSVPCEVGWLGVVEQIKHPNRVLPDFLIKEIILPSQEAHYATTAFLPDDLFKLFDELMKRPGFDPNTIRFWGHSHADMEVFASAQDDKQVEDFREDGYEYVIRGIFNKKGKIMFSIYFFELGISIHDAKWSLHYPPPDEKRREHWQKLITERVRKAKFSYGPTYGTGTGTYHNRHWNKWHRNSDAIDDVDDYDEDPWEDVIL